MLPEKVGKTSERYAHTQVSSRQRELKPLVTLVISHLVGKLAAKGREIINMSPGELDFLTLKPIVREAIVALHDGRTRYTDVATLPSPKVKVLIIAKFCRENQLAFTSQ